MIRNQNEFTFSVIIIWMFYPQLLCMRNLPTEGSKNYPSSDLGKEELRFKPVCFRLHGIFYNSYATLYI